MLYKNYVLVGDILKSNKKVEFFFNFLNLMLSVIQLVNVYGLEYVRNSLIKM